MRVLKIPTGALNTDAIEGILVQEDLEGWSVVVRTAGNDYLYATHPTRSEAMAGVTALTNEWLGISPDPTPSVFVPRHASCSSCKTPLTNRDGASWTHDFGVEEGGRNWCSTPLPMDETDEFAVLIEGLTFDEPEPEPEPGCGSCGG